jgi:hypothetical protein
MSDFSAISWREQVTFWWDDDDVRFILDQHTHDTEFDFYSVSTELTETIVVRNVAPLGHIILITIQPVFTLTH